MRRLLPLVFIAFAWPASSSAAPLCASATLDVYVALGAGGCEIGGATFSGFSVAASNGGGSQIDADQILVTPFDLGLDFGLNAAASAGDLTGILIGFNLAASSIGTAALSMTGSSASPDGVVTVVQDICVGGLFSPFPVCGGSGQTQILADDGFPSPVLDDFDAFPVDSFFDVFVDITIDGGLNGAAAIDGTVRTAFRQGASVPEPSSLLLVGAALAGSLVRRRRTSR